MRKDAKTIILLYTDAAPHTSMNGKVGDRGSYLGNELKALNDKSSCKYSFSRIFVVPSTRYSFPQSWVGQNRETFPLFAFIRSDGMC